MIDTAKQKIVVLAELTVQPSLLEEAIAITLANQGPSLKEPGCEVFTITSKKDDPYTLVFFEVWSSQKALDEHMQTSYAKEFFEKIPAVLEKPPMLQFLSLIA
ncbi:MAG TPA: putative quinol monooxygenase [Ohtaekwangia sp.]|uniref:putative quinol monooxygenase n=1 Tax=Ohtaekwangia sp. TaxID=2066019 RepID=UPI002F930087